MIPLLARHIATAKQADMIQRAAQGYRGEPASAGSNLKDIFIYGTLSLLVAGGAIFLATKYIQGIRGNIEDRKSLEDGSAAAYAKRIKMAFDNDGWPGTDEEALRTVMRQIPSRQTFEQVVSSYKLQFGEELLDTMRSELSLSAYNEMNQIMAGKPQKSGTKAVLNPVALARRLKAAFDKTYGFIPSTDRDAIKAVFTEIPTHAAFIQVGTAYFKEFGKNLTDALKGELGLYQYNDMMKIIVRKPQK